MPADPPPPRQLGLFGPIEPDPSLPVQPALVPTEVIGVAARLPALLRLGTSSWTFAGWSGIVYAARTPQSRLAQHGLAAYARHPLLRTVGVDRTFYAPIDRRAFASMAAAVPEDFRFLVKAWADCTTPFRRGAGGRPDGANARYLDAAVATDLVVAPAIEGLGDRLGPMVFQFPPQGREITRAPEAFADRLHAFCAALPRSLHCAIELRDAELLTARHVQALRAAGAHHCFSVHPRMPSIARQRELVDVGASGPVVVRWMLHPGLGYDEAKDRYQPFTSLVDPDPEQRAAIARLCLDAIVRSLPVTVVVNNKAEGSAPLSLIELAHAIAARAQ